MTKVQLKKAQLDIIEKLFSTLDEAEKDTKSNFMVVGKKAEQAKSWRTGELLWEDEEKTIPKYEDKYDYVPIPEAELSDERKAKIKAIEDLREVLDKYI